MQIFVRSLTGKTVTLDVSTDETILKLKQKYQDKEAIPVEYQVFIYAGKELDNNKTLYDYSIQNEMTLNFVQRLPGGF